MIRQEQLNEMFQPLVGTTLNEISFTKEYVKLAFYGQGLNSKVDMEIEKYDAEDYYELLYNLNTFNRLKVKNVTPFVSNISRISEVFFHLYYVLDDDCDSYETKTITTNNCVIRCNCVVWVMANNNVNSKLMRKQNE